MVPDRFRTAIRQRPTPVSISFDTLRSGDAIFSGSFSVNYILLMRCGMGMNRSYAGGNTKVVVVYH